MFKSILIANRGEIALRIVRACREMGIRSVVAHSTADSDTLAVRLADESVCIGPAPATESYLQIDRIIAAAESRGVDAIHPGYGFLAENAHFAEVCEECGITFIGPSPEAIRSMGDKAQARATMIAGGVPVTPGSEGVLKSEDEALAEARRIGYPVMLKASAGGGGKGMRMVHKEEDLLRNFAAASTEALRGFGDGSIYMEKLIVGPKHIEIQIVGDSKGNVVHLGERDCSLQRRHQKLMEEAPSPAVDPELRDKMGRAAVLAAKAANYVTAGTVEFLLDSAGHFYFMEMNTRIQVEHPVTEMVTGIDLIQAQILTAAGEELPFTQDDVVINGHAIEVRINAEDPSRNFAPCPGLIEEYNPAGGPGVRVDSHAYTGYVIPPNYDSMVGKLIVHGKNRKEAINRCRRALAEFTVGGVATTIEFVDELLDQPAIREGNYDTGYLETFIKQEDS